VVPSEEISIAVFLVALFREKVKILFVLIHDDTATVVKPSERFSLFLS
jgi:hypothetical protein